MVDNFIYFGEWVFLVVVFGVEYYGNGICYFEVIIFD